MDPLILTIATLIEPKKKITNDITLENVIFAGNMKQRQIHKKERFWLSLHATKSKVCSRQQLLKGPHHTIYT